MKIPKTNLIPFCFILYTLENAYEDTSLEDYLYFE